jgi:hypothetical protein
MPKPPKPPGKPPQEPLDDARARAIVEELRRLRASLDLIALSIQVQTVAIQHIGAELVPNPAKLTALTHDLATHRKALEAALAAAPTAKE